MDADVLVVGAGPAGCSTALHLTARDPCWAGRVLVVDRARFPRPKLCGGGVTHFGYRTLEALGLGGLECFGARTIRARFREREVAFHGDPTVRVVRREVFDARLVEAVRARGVEVRESVDVRGVEVLADRVEVATGDGRLTAAVVVGADGSGSRVRRCLDWAGRSGVAGTLEVLAPVDPETDPDHREQAMTLDFSAVSSHRLQGYTWAFPALVEGRPHTSLGVYDSRLAAGRRRASLDPVLAELVAARGLDPDALPRHTFPIRLWDGASPVAGPRAILAGDAAGADPLLGEGIPFALAHGEVAAAAIEAAIGSGDLCFADHRRRMDAHPVLRQLPTRVAVARVFYRIRNPLLLTTLWHVVARLVRNLDAAGHAWHVAERWHRALRGV